MKYLYINSKLEGEAERIYVDEQRKQITGYNGDSDTPAFVLRGVKFENITYEIKDDTGKAVEPDKDADQELYETLEKATNFDELKKALLGQMSRARVKGKPVQ